MFLDLQVQRGEFGSNDVGDLQTYSNIDSDDRLQLAKFWYEQTLLDGGLHLKLGKVDGNTDFAYLENGFRFLNSTFGYSPTVVGMPSYPDSAFGLMAFARPGGGFYVGGGVFDGAGQEGFRTGQRGLGTVFGAPSDLFMIVEGGRRWTGDRPGRLAVGLHRHTGSFERFDGGTNDHADGFYLTLDQALWHPDPDSERGLAGFVSYVQADADISPVRRVVAMGVEWVGPLASRPLDACGIACTSAEFTGAQGAAFRGTAETAYELFYTYQATRWLRIKPDLQFIQNPGGAGIADAWVFTLRFAVTF